MCPECILARATAVHGAARIYNHGTKSNSTVVRRKQKKRKQKRKEMAKEDNQDEGDSAQSL